MLEQLNIKVRATITQIDEVIARGGWVQCDYTISVQDGEYTSLYTIEASNKADAEHDNASSIGKFNKVGDLVDAEFSLRGARNMWQSPDASRFPKAFHKLAHFRLTKVNAAMAGAVEDSDVPEFDAPII